MAAAQTVWDEHVSNNFDRVAGLVRIEAKGRLNAQELEDATQDALLRLLTNAVNTFRGHTMGEWVEMTKKLVHFACIDRMKKSEKVSKREGALRYSPSEDDEAPEYSKQVYKAMDRERDVIESAAEDEEVLAEGKTFLAWALPQLSEKRRQVLELLIAGHTVPEIQEITGNSRDVVYQDKARAIKDLVRLRGEAVS